MHVSFPFLSTLAVALTLSSARAEDIRLSSADMQAQIVGNTMVGYYENGEDWREYFDPSGEIHGEDEMHGLYTAKYWITENLMCFDYPWDGADWCASIS